MTICTASTQGFEAKISTVTVGAPTVTVVIPSYNNARYIGQTLDSIKAQTFTDYEVIVVNDGSEDREELERVLESHPLPIVYISQENKGMSAARNAAIRSARAASSGSVSFNTR